MYLFFIYFFFFLIFEYLFTVNIPHTEVIGKDEVKLLEATFCWPDVVKLPAQQWDKNCQPIAAYVSKIFHYNGIIYLISLGLKQ